VCGLLAHGLCESVHDPVRCPAVEDEGVATLDDDSLMAHKEVDTQAEREEHDPVARGIDVQR